MPLITTRRQATLGVALALSSAVLTSASPSLAFLGFGEDVQQQYTDSTVSSGAELPQGEREGGEDSGRQLGALFFTWLRVGYL